jgi:hypothetical protein
MPRPAAWILDRFANAADGEAIAGDIYEAYRAERSSIWLWRQVLAAVVAVTWSQVRDGKGSASYAIVVGWLLMTEFAGLGTVLAGTRPGPWFVAFWSWHSLDLYLYCAIVCLSALATGAIVSLLHGRSMLLAFAATVVVVDLWAIARYPWGNMSHPAFLLPTIAAVGLIGVPCSLVLGGTLGPQRMKRV